MSLVQRTGGVIDWVIRGEMVWRILVALGAGKLVQILLAARIPEQYRTAVWLLVSAAILWLLVQWGRWANKNKAPVVQTTALATTAKVSSQIEIYRKNLDVDLLQECEGLIQAEANGYKNAAEREAFLLHGFSTILLIGFFDITWHIIFASQIRALERLNKGAASIEELRTYYNQGLEKRPQYPFESWFGYMKDNTLLRQDGHNIQITVRGKAFLKYLVQYGRTVADKPQL